MANQLSQRMGQSVIVVNKPGAAGRIGLNDVAQSPPDGYTIADVLLGNIVAAPALYPDTQFDPLKDFTPVTLTTAAPYVLGVAANSPIKTYEDLIAQARARPDQISYASAGIGSTVHIATELLSRAAHVKMRHVPYSGAAQSIVDVMAGRVDVIFTNLTTLNSHMQSGAIRALAITGDKRASVAPNVPTFKELGLDFDFQSWHGVVTSANVPPAIVEKLGTELKAVLSDPTVLKAIEADGSSIRTSTPAQFRDFLESEYQRVKTVITEAGIKPE
jgi:tripartite-type tricarboxylate transporter receptor subunit TctC